MASTIIQIELIATAAIVTLFAFISAVQVTKPLINSKIKSKANRKAYKKTMYGLISSVVFCPLPFAFLCIKFIDYDGTFLKLADVIVAFCYFLTAAVTSHFMLRSFLRRWHKLEECDSEEEIMEFLE